MLPRVGRPEVILEVMSWLPGFVESFTSVSGGRSRLDDLHVSIAACLSAHAMNIDFSEVITTPRWCPRGSTGGSGGDCGRFAGRSGSTCAASCARAGGRHSRTQSPRCRNLRAIVPFGGHDTVFVLWEGRWIVNGLEHISALKGLKEKLRGSQLPVMLGIPFGLTIETIPTHLPLPAKIRTELLTPIHVDQDPERVNDRAYVNSIYHEVQSAIQHAMDRLAKRRRFPIFG